MFVDEVGNGDLKSSIDPNHRYLSLTGVIVDMDNYAVGLDASFRRLKREHLKNESVIFHRREMIDRKEPFHILKEGNRGEEFNADLLSVVADLNYVALTVVIDKREHGERYGKWQFHSYHYCLTCLVERYVKWLVRNNGWGDVLAESRNRFEDEKLKQSYARFYKNGSRFVRGRDLLDRLTSGELKLKKKTANINGLQLTDILASPSFRSMLCVRENVPMTAMFGRQIAAILRSKYDKNPHTHKVDGYGCKWLP